MKMALYGLGLGDRFEDETFSSFKNNYASLRLWFNPTPTEVEFIAIDSGSAPHLLIYVYVGFFYSYIKFVFDVIIFILIVYCDTFPIFLYSIIMTMTIIIIFQYFLVFVFIYAQFF